MNKKSQIIIVAATIAIVIAILIGSITIFSLTKDEKYNKLIDQGKMYILQEEGDLALDNFEKARKLYPERQEVNDYIALVKEYKKLNSAFESLDGEEVLLIVENINNMNYYELIDKKVIAIEKAMDDNINLMKEIDSLETNLPKLVKDNKFDEMLGEIERLKSTRFNKEYTEKLNSLDKKVVEAKELYDINQGKIEAEKENEQIAKEEELKKKEDELKKREEELKRKEKEEQNKNSVIRRVYRIYYYDNYYNLYYVDKELEVKGKAVVTALTNALKQEPPSNYVGAMKVLNSKDTVRSAKVDNGVLYVNLSSSVNDAKYGAGFEDAVISCLVNTYGYNLGVSRVNITVGENNDFIGSHSGIREFDVNVRGIEKLK